MTPRSSTLRTPSNFNFLIAALINVGMTIIVSMLESAATVACKMN